MDTLLSQTVTIKRRDATLVGPDPFVTSVESKCRLKSASGERVLQLPIGLFTVTHVLFLPAGTDVVESDRIFEVQDAAGNAIAEDLRIGLVRKVAGGDGLIHHLEVLCTAVKDPAV